MGSLEDTQKNGQIYLWKATYTNI